MVYCLLFIVGLPYGIWFIIELLVGKGLFMVCGLLFIVGLPWT
jgi:hypothetical protein